MYSVRDQIKSAKSVQDVGALLSAIATPQYRFMAKDTRNKIKVAAAKKIAELSA